MEPMDIYSMPESKLIFNGIHGQDYQLNEAKSLMEIGEIVTLECLQVNRFSTDIYLKEFPGKSFNSVMFSNLIGVL